MRRRTLLGLSIGAMALIGGCGLPRVNGSPTEPMFPPVTVTVTGTSTCTISPPPDIRVNGRQSPVLQWQLADPNTYEFASNGIAFDKNAYAPPSGEFTSRGIANGRFMVKDKNHARGRFDYSIRVKVKGTAVACTLDPTVYNDGSCPDTGC